MAAPIRSTMSTCSRGGSPKVAAMKVCRLLPGFQVFLPVKAIAGGFFA
jgi:hypothetical protein